MIMVQYLLDAGEAVVTPAVAAPQTAFADPVSPVALALDQERRVTDQISALAALAREENDFIAEQFLGWFLKEQLEEVSSMSALLAVVERAAVSNIQFAEEHLARTAGAAGGPELDAPPAAGGAL
jgi:ferritin